jgi:uncharacterized protein (TIGR03083 family)
MPASLSFDDYGDALGNAWTVLRENAARAGLDAEVPTCPGWTVRDLVAHQGMVHRWAAGAVRGRRDDGAADALRNAGLASDDLLGWLDEGARDLLAALALTPDDPGLAFFLPDAPPGKAAWARRQCHETTIHAVDAMAAARGRAPLASETWIRPSLAHDGLDELLCGFLPRRNVRLRAAQPYLVVVRTGDTNGTWTMQVCPDGVVTTAAPPLEERESPRPEPLVELGGTAAGLYLGLWNRGNELTASEPGLLDRWRSQVTVRW